MANKFVKDRAALKAVTNGVSGDVYYLTDQEEVYDVVNTKLALPNTGCFKVASGVWAVLNREKTLNYRLTKPTDFVLANKYTKGTLITKDGDVYIANSDIAENTAFTAGTTGATWKKLAGPVNSAGWFGNGNLSTLSPAYGAQATLSQTDAYKAPFNGVITKVKLSLRESSTTWRVGIFTSSEAKDIRPTIKAHSTLSDLNLSSGVQEVALSGSLSVLAGEYVGVICSNGGTGAWTHRVPYVYGLNDGGTFWGVGGEKTLDSAIIGTSLVAGSNSFTAWSPVFQYYIEPVA